MKFLFFTTYEILLIKKYASLMIALMYHMMYQLRHVSSYVIFEAIFPWKARLAMLTLIWFLFGMNSYVIL